MIEIKDKHYGTYYVPLHRVKELHPNVRMNEAGEWEHIISVILEDENITSVYHSKAARDIALENMTMPSLKQPSIDNLEELEALKEVRAILLELHNKINKLLPKPEL